jgi:hypothetical protein
MIRQLAIELALFLTPFAVYALFVWAARPGDAKAAAWSSPVLTWLTLSALVLAIGGFVVWSRYSGAPPGSAYVPAHIENGRFVPGAQK